MSLPGIEMPSSSHSHWLCHSPFHNRQYPCPTDCWPQWISAKIASFAPKSSPYFQVPHSAAPNNWGILGKRIRFPGKMNIIFRGQFLHTSLPIVYGVFSNAATVSNNCCLQIYKFILVYPHTVPPPFEWIREIWWIQHLQIIKFPFQFPQKNILTATCNWAPLFQNTFISSKYLPI